jgi:hypothetical protein
MNREYNIKAMGVDNINEHLQWEVTCGNILRMPNI